MTQQNILDELKKLIIEKLDVKESDIVEQASFRDDLGADSLMLVELIMNIEEHFGIKIPDEDAEKLTTIGAVVSYINEKKEEDI